MPAIYVNKHVGSFKIHCSPVHRESSWVQNEAFVLCKLANQLPSHWSFPYGSFPSMPCLPPYQHSQWVFPLTPAWQWAGVPIAWAAQHARIADERAALGACSHPRDCWCCKAMCCLEMLTCTVTFPCLGLPFSFARNWLDPMCSLSCSQPSPILYTQSTFSFC